MRDNTLFVMALIAVVLDDDDDRNVCSLFESAIKPKTKKVRARQLFFVICDRPLSRGNVTLRKKMNNE
jgi:hypothetical protein